MPEAHEKRMTIAQHLEELRRRVLYALLGPVVGFVVCFFFLRDQVLFCLLRPMYPAWRLFGHDLLVVQPVEVRLTLNAPYTAVFNYMYVAFLAGCIATAPWWIYQLWAFVAAGLYPRERRKVAAYGATSLALFFAGAAFFFFVIYPLTMSVLYGFADEFNAYLASQGLQPMLDKSTLFDNYMNFALLMALVCGLMFELPLVVLFLGRMGLVSLASFRKYRRLAILIIFVVAAVASPGPDVVSQLCLAIPMILLYELGLILLRFSKRKEPAA